MFKSKKVLSNSLQRNSCYYEIKTIHYNIIFYYTTYIIFDYLCVYDWNYSRSIINTNIEKHSNL